MASKGTLSPGWLPGKRDLANIIEELGGQRAVPLFTNMGSRVLVAAKNDHESV